MFQFIYNYIHALFYNHNTFFVILGSISRIIIPGISSYASSSSMSFTFIDEIHTQVMDPKKINCSVPGFGFRATPQLLPQSLVLLVEGGRELLLPNNLKML